VGLLFQNYALFPNMNVRQNLMTGLLPYEKDKKKAAKAIKDMMDKFSLTGLEDHKPSQLSGGQQQRVALARIFLSKPRMLMLDEPFSALDEYLRWNLEMELSDILREFGGSTLFVSHSREEIYRICDRVCVMDQGKSSAVIPVKQMFSAPESKAAALLSGCKNYSKVKRMGEMQIYAGDWGVTFDYHGEMPESFGYIGVRSHYIYPVLSSQVSEWTNVFCGKIVKIVEDVFSMVIMLCPENAEETRGGQIRVEMTKEAWTDFVREEKPDGKMWVRIDDKDIMLLK
jgi:molybdate transport system ATP-binding protein